MTTSRLNVLGCLVETLYCIADHERREWHRRLEHHIVKVSPELAAVWLTMLDPGQRGKLKANQRKLRQDITAGRWKHTHQGICFSYIDGVLSLVDGQHRLTELVRSGKTLVLEVAVMSGITVRDPIDTNGVRSRVFLTGLGKRENPVVSDLLQYLAGNTAGCGTYSAGEILEAYYAHQAEIDSVIAAVSGGYYWRAPVVAAIVFAHPIAPKEMLAFATQLSTGEGLSKGDPALALRESVFRSRGEGQVASEKALSDLTFSAIQAVIEGRKLAKVYAKTNAYDNVRAWRAEVAVP